MKFSIITYLWHAEPKQPWKKPYCSDDARILAGMAFQQVSIPYRFICITDRPEEFDGDPLVEAVPLDQRIHLKGTCYAKLFTFSPLAKELLGDYVLQIDLDSMIVGDVAPLCRWNEDLIMWRNPLYNQYGYLNDLIENKYCQYNASVIFHKCGTMTDIYDMFDPEHPPARDDQWYLCDVLGHWPPSWGGRDGIYRIRRNGMPFSGISGELPGNARIVTFPGDSHKPWLENTIEENPWISEHRRPL